MNYNIMPTIALSGGILGRFIYPALTDKHDDKFPLHESNIGFAIGEYIGIITGSAFDYLSTNDNDILFNYISTSTLALFMGTIGGLYNVAKFHSEDNFGPKHIVYGSTIGFMIGETIGTILGEISNYSNQNE